MGSLAFLKCTGLYCALFSDERLSFDAHYNSTIQAASGDAKELLTLTQKLAKEKDEMTQRHAEATKAFDTQLVMQIDQKVIFKLIEEKKVDEDNMPMIRIDSSTSSTSQLANIYEIRMFQDFLSIYKISCRL